MDGSREPGTEPTAVPESALPDEPLAEAASDAGSAGDGWGEGEKTETVTGREWLSQLQKMIDDVATQAAPVARQVAAKAAELAAAGAAAAGPLAHKAADVTSDVSAKLADRATQLAKDLRSAEAEAAADDTNGTGADATNGTGDVATGSATDATSDAPAAQSAADETAPTG